jgi:hypothetical protein
VDLAARLATTVTLLSRLHDRVVVGIDGPDGAGKTTLAGRLTDALQVKTLQACVDGFNRPRAQRYRRGELSAGGYYLDSFDYRALRNECLLPFLGGESSLRTSAFDHHGDVRENITVAVPTRAVLVVDAVFLLRPELRELWTLSVEPMRRSGARIAATSSCSGRPRRSSAGIAGDTCQARCSTGNGQTPRRSPTSSWTTNAPTHLGSSAGPSRGSSIAPDQPSR